MYYKKTKILLSSILLTVTLMMTYSFCYAKNFPNNLTLSENSADQDISDLTDENTSGKTIALSESGTYILIGPDQDKPIDDDNIVVVDPNDIILINKSGNYDIILQNVNIDVSEIENAYALSVDSNLHANINITLVGENALKGNRGGILVGPGSNLTITGLNSIDSLFVCGENSGIKALGDLTIKQGQIIVNGHRNGICSKKITIKDGDIRIRASSLGSYGIDAGDLIINNGDIDVSGDINGICVSNLQINKGNINVFSENGFGIFGSSKIIINGGDIISNTNETSVYQDEYTFFGIKGGTFNGTDAIEFFKNLLTPSVSPNAEPSLNQ